MNLAADPLEMKRRKIKIEKPVARPLHVNEQVWQEVQHYLRMIPQEPDPNLGRVREIRQEIEQGTFLRPEMIEETAARLAIRFVKKL